MKVELLFQLGVPADTFRYFSEEQAKTVAAKQSPGLVTNHRSFETFCPNRGVTRDHAPLECHRRGPAELGEQVLVSVSQNDVSDRAVRKREILLEALVPRSEGVAAQAPVCGSGPLDATS